ncbi:MAG: hypothetical protein GEU93_13500 [Propionibacteriales bacterium]|nr:hypothetical protein [Propionibacteriales bacterium]
MLTVVQIPDHDQERAAAEHRARSQLLDAGASTLPRAPWLHGEQPVSSVDLIRFALWRGSAGRLTEEDVRAALTLLSAARAEVDQLEAGMLFTARAQGLSWSRISRAMGLGSAQAALQRFGRITSRVESRGES